MDKYLLKERIDFAIETLIPTMNKSMDKKP